MSDSENIIDIADYRDKRVIFTQKKLDEKSEEHPELRRTKFLKNIERVIADPEVVWEDYADRKNRRCYYGKYSKNTYIKVVIWIKSTPCRVITAYEIDKVKEENYTGLKQII